MAARLATAQSVLRPALAPALRHVKLSLRAGWIWRSASTIAKAEAQGPPLPPLKAAKAKREAQTMLTYIRDTQQRFPNAVVMTQVGAFMELYFDQAVEFGPKLNLKVARKAQAGPDGQPFVNMAGFPLQHKEKYEKMIVHDWGRTVVSLMQDSRYLLRGGSEAEKRPVARVLTPGTLLAESFVDMTINNYLCCVQPAQSQFCVMWVDVASGAVKYQFVDEADLGNTLSRISPSEVLVGKSTHRSVAGVESAVAAYAPQAALSRHQFPPIEWWNTRASASQRFGIESLGTAAARAFVGLVSYIDECMPGSRIDVQPPARFFSTRTMQMDARARDALELTATSARGTRSSRGSLLSVIRRTQTQSGARLLQEWLTAPLQNPEEISARQNKVQFFLDLNRAKLVQIQQLLAELPDGPRVLQKLWQPSVDPLDLAAFARSVNTFSELRAVLAQLAVPRDWQRIFEELSTELLNFASRVEHAINMDNVVAESEEGPRRRPGASSATKIAPATNRDYIPVLNPDISDDLQAIYRRESGFAAREREIDDRIKRTYGPSADLRWSPTHQFYVYIVANGSNEPDPSLLLGRSKKTCYVADAEWAALGTERLELSSDLRSVEERILDELRTTIVTEFVPVMRKLYALGDEIDVQLSLAVLAIEKKLVRPEIVEDPHAFVIEKGRHITVETGLATGGFASGFVANDCDLSAPQPICMITGPNMGGKSTYIRQNAVITVLAHIGSFVPAKSARIGVVDRIFCRIGAGDDLYNGRSTFMMEMLETSSILTNATNRSLAILDEVGRGTSGKDGIAIAYASIKHLTLKKQCRTLFATHYGEEIWGLMARQRRGAELTRGIRLLQASLRVDGPPGAKQIKFDYQLKPGISSSSCGLLIAELAGFPDSALKDALAVAGQI